LMTSRIFTRVVFSSEVIEHPVNAVNLAH
jgi:hypothetical protein